MIPSSTLPPGTLAQRQAQLLSSLHLSDRHAAATAGAGIGPATGRRLPRWAVTLLVLQAFGLAALAYRGLDGHAEVSAVPSAHARPAEPAPASATPPAHTADARFEASGFISATRTATVSARTMGQVAEVLVDEGARVRRGQVLARLADQQARTELGLAEAQLAATRARAKAAQAQWHDAQREQAREQSLRDQGFTSDARLGKAVTTTEVAHSALAAARADAALAALQVQRQAQALDDFTVRAPFDGVVLARNAQVGEIVAPGSAGGGYTRTGIYTIVDMQSLEIIVDVNEDMLRSVEPGRQVRAELYSHKGWQLAGEVLRIMPNADRAKSTVRVRIRLLENDPRILPDMAVKVVFL
ncbi:efflux RND transporter periplasmic adaptor subunit [Pseudorhodoferax sp.]|uniref:efflux RND transporter periplasmic adaptor subunit n=1 Tax=Pseudorhodoferax sp. TaxID=1993553 RepID=UPI002DD69C27|nr:efflux RND transporter periplasmic adaptor subunit [Pseudorhodoferax sp.]